MLCQRGSEGFTALRTRAKYRQLRGCLPPCRPSWMANRIGVMSGDDSSSGALGMGYRH